MRSELPIIIRFDFWKSRPAYLTILLIYTLSYGLMLLSRGLYLDDWVIYNQPFSSILEMLKESSGAAGYLTGFLYHALLSLPQCIWTHRLLTFLFFLLSGFFLDKILETISEMDAMDRTFIVSLFLLVPLFDARSSLMCFFYSFDHLLFFLAFYIFVKRGASISGRISALSLFLISFLANSLIMFYGVFLVYLFYKERAALGPVSSFFKVMLRNLDCFAIPILSLVFKSVFCKPSGIYLGYNRITPSIILGTSYEMILRVSKESFLTLTHINPIFLIVTVFLILLSYMTHTRKTELTRQKSDFIFLTFGVFAYLVAIFPYIAVGKPPLFYDWDTRHQLLMPLGTSFVLYYTIKIALSQFRIHRHVLYIGMSVLLSVFTIANIKNQFSYMDHWYKELSIMENMRVSEIVKNNTTFLFTDNTKDYNVHDSFLRFYELTGFMKQVFRDQTRFGMVDYEYHYYTFIMHDDLGKYFTYRYNMKDYKRKAFDCTITINKGAYALSPSNRLKLILYAVFNAARFKEHIKDVVRFEYSKS